jgi:hypothetical protein
MQMASKAMLSINTIDRGLIMKCLKSLSVLGVVLATSYAGLAQAALTSASPPLCTASNALNYMSAVACSGAWDDNNLNQKIGVLAELAASFNDEVGINGAWTYIGTTNATETSGPFGSVPGETSGTLTFDTAQKGWFALALKADGKFSLYLFDGGQAGIINIPFITNGVALNNSGDPQALSHASLYLAPVPEPQTYALMLAGLGLVGFAASRRKAA